jgi:hypothetical protein
MMENNSQAKENNKLTDTKIMSWEFGTAVFAAGVVNTFWGNDMFFGIFLLLLSLVYFLPVNTITKKLAGISIPRLGLLKIILGIFVVWAVLGVGELFDKLEMMRIDLLVRN